VPRHLLEAKVQLEELRLTLQQLSEIIGEIIGEFTSDDLLGRIFSNFCIGK